MGHVCPPAQQEALLTRSVLVLFAVENMREAQKLAASYLAEIETDRPPVSLKKSYLEKMDGKAPSHVMFCCMLVRIFEKDAKTAPLSPFPWASSPWPWPWRRPSPWPWSLWRAVVVVDAAVAMAVEGEVAVAAEVAMA